MPRLPTPCIDCGNITETTRCPDCERQFNRVRTTSRRDRDNAKNLAVKTAQNGYDNAWNRLSRKARELQPFCSDCGATTDLQADHSPEAWKRKAKGLAIRLQDIDVVCGRCNRRRGAARGERARSDSKATFTRAGIGG